MSGKLIFPQADPGNIAGFESSASYRAARGDAEKVVRELLQNCLDARKDDKVTINITIDSIPSNQLPDREGYECALKEAYRQRKKAQLDNPNDKKVRDRMLRALKFSDIPVLYCRDDGEGLDESATDKLLSEGNTGKRADKGAGSVGLGHLTAFSASDLRYVLYGGKRDAETVVAGRTILASHENDGAILSEKGTLAKSLADDQSLAGGCFRYLTSVPAALAREMEKVGESGTVVAILGFNRFGRNGNHDTVDLIRGIAAAHFLPAIYQGRMEIILEDKTDSSPVKRKLNKDSLEETLNADGGFRQTTERRLPDGIAHRAWRTLREWQELKCGAGATILYRELEKEERHRQRRVNLYREGMWITWKAKGLAPHEFSDCEFFDAIVLPDEGNRFGDLVRSSEGPDHYGINLEDLPHPERKELRNFLKEIAEVIRSKARRTHAKRWSPPGFASFAVDESLEKIPAPTRSGKTDDDPESGGNSAPDPEQPGGGSGEGPVIKRSGERGASRTRSSSPPLQPKWGKPARLSVAMREILGEYGDGRQVIMGLDVALKKHPYRLLGVRIKRSGGEDGTSSVVDRPDYLRISPGDDSGTVTDDWEISIGADHLRFEIELDEPWLADNGVLELDAVERK